MINENRWYIFSSFNDVQTKEQLTWKKKKIVKTRVPLNLYIRMKGGNLITVKEFLKESVIFGKKIIYFTWAESS